MFKFTNFYLRTGLPGDRNRLQGVDRDNCQDGLPHTLPDGDCVATPTVNPWVRSPDRTMHNEQTESHTKTKNTKYKQRASHGPKLPPGKKNDTITAAFRGGGFSLFPPGSNCLFSSLGVLSLGLWLAFRMMVFDEFAGVVAIPAHVPNRSVGEEVSSP